MLSITRLYNDWSRFYNDWSRFYNDWSTFITIGRLFNDWSTYCIRVIEFSSITTIKLQINKRVILFKIWRFSTVIVRNRGFSRKFTKIAVYRDKYKISQYRTYCNKFLPLLRPQTSEVPGRLDFFSKKNWLYFVPRFQ